MACVSVTAACGSATPLLSSRSTGAVLGTGFLRRQRPAKRGVEQVPYRFVCPLEQRIAGIDVDRADDRSGRTDIAALARRGHEPVEQIAEAPRSGCGGPAL